MPVTEEQVMRIVREYFGLDRTTVVYDNDISGVGGNQDEFFILAEVGTPRGTSLARTTMTFSHDEMSRILADYRRHYPVASPTTPALIGGTRSSGFIAKVQSWLAVCCSLCFGGRSIVTSERRRHRPWQRRVHK